jgi:hypothetical protein
VISGVLLRERLLSHLQPLIDDPALDCMDEAERIAYFRADELPHEWLDWAARQP